MRFGLSKRGKETAARAITCAALALCMVLFLPRAQAVEVDAYPALQKIMRQLISEDAYPEAELRKVLARAKIKPDIIALIERPSERLPWHKYEKLFITDERIAKGVNFWRANAKTLARAQQKYGVPAAVIVAVIGVETHYGTRLGSHRVLDALVTLTADFPRRSAFFGKELRVFLNTARAENIAPEKIKGSYAGAIGIPQFMPSSYQAYAVDFNANARRDLTHEVEDAIGSVANYLQVHGWRRQQPIYAQVTRALPEAAQAWVGKRAKPKWPLAKLTAAGVAFASEPPPATSAKGALLKLELTNGARHIIALDNFYALTRYNTSVNYAMAVAELSRRIAARF